MIDAGIKKVKIISPFVVKKRFTPIIISPTAQLPPLTKTISGTIKDRMKVPVQRRRMHSGDQPGSLSGKF